MDLSNTKPTITVFVRYFLPGFKSGGPIRTIANIVDHLGMDFTFRIITSDRDALDDKPYPGMSLNKWNRLNNAFVYYLVPGIKSLLRLPTLINRSRPHAIYLNSFFSPRFTILPLICIRLRLAKKCSIVLAPRGEFAIEALKFKYWKKTSIIQLGRLMGFYNNIIWQASSEFEVNDIRRMMGDTAKRIVVAPNLPSRDRLDPGNPPRVRKNGIFSILFLSRISPIKNLDYAIRVISKIKTKVIFDIYGPVRDQDYWQECQELIATTGSKATISYKGSIHNSMVRNIMADYDLFFLPTRSENFGHVILESLSVGTPLLISNKTPWRDLEKKGVGWDLPLTNEAAFVEKIDYATSLSMEAYTNWKKFILCYAAELSQNSSALEANRDLFTQAIRMQ